MALTDDVTLPTMTVVTMVEQHERQERLLAVGDPVEVRNRFDARWIRGFVVDEVVADGFHVRRLSDDQVIPSVFAREEVRREHRRGQWWY
jgi:hypothetical protein